MHQITDTRKLDSLVPSNQTHSYYLENEDLLNKKKPMDHDEEHQYPLFFYKKKKKMQLEAKKISNRPPNNLVAQTIDVKQMDVAGIPSDINVRKTRENSLNGSNEKWSFNDEANIKDLLYNQYMNEYVIN